MTNEMTPEDARKYLRTLFTKAGRPDGRYRTDEEQFDYLSRDGAQRFKRKALKLYGYPTIKNLDEVAQLLVETGITPTLEEAQQTVPKIAQANKLHSHAISRKSLCTYLGFDEVKGQNGDVKYRITAWTAD